MEQTQATIAENCGKLGGRHDTTSPRVRQSAIADKLPFGRSASVHGVGIMVQPKPLVLVTGASGFIGSHCILALLGSNKFSVRGTVRSIGSKSTAHLTAHPGLKDATLVEADLLKDAGWDAAVAGCDYVLHVASPFPIGKVPENSLVQPAVEGTERVLCAAAKNKVKRVVLTSSVAAVSGGRADGDVEERTVRGERVGLTLLLERLLQGVVVHHLGSAQGKRVGR